MMIGNLLSGVVPFVLAGWLMAQTATVTTPAAGDREAHRYYREVLARAKRIGQEDLTSKDAEQASRLLEMAPARLPRLFEVLSDKEAFQLGVALSRLDFRYGDDKLNTLTLMIWELFLELFPESPLADDARWEHAKTKATPYEYEGYADAAIQQINGLERFIKENPANRCIYEAELEMAKACRIAYETLRYGDGMCEDPSIDRRKVSRQYHQRARRLLQHLCSAATGHTRSAARKALADLDAGRCIYHGPGSPNEAVTDAWVDQPSK